MFKLLDTIFGGLVGLILLVAALNALFGEPVPGSENLFAAAIGDPSAAIDYEPLKTAIAEALAELSQETPGDI